MRRLAWPNSSPTGPVKSACDVTEPSPSNVSPGMTSGDATQGVALSQMAVLMLSVFTVSMGFGVLLPLLPYLIERIRLIGRSIHQRFVPKINNKRHSLLR